MFRGRRRFTAGPTGFGLVCAFLCEVRVDARSGNVARDPRARHWRSLDKDRYTSFRALEIARARVRPPVFSRLAITVRVYTNPLCVVSVFGHFGVVLEKEGTPKGKNPRAPCPVVVFVFRVACDSTIVIGVEKCL